MRTKERTITTVHPSYTPAVEREDQTKVQQLIEEILPIIFKESRVPVTRVKVEKPGPATNVPFGPETIKPTRKAVLLEIMSNASYRNGRRQTEGETTDTLAARLKKLIGAILGDAFDVEVIVWADIEGAYCYGYSLSRVEEPLPRHHREDKELIEKFQ